MKQGRTRGHAAEREDMHLRIMVERAVREGKSGREIEALLKQAEGHSLLRNWPLSRAA
jgi:hypothetical protein